MTRGLLILLLCACAAYAYQFSADAKVTFTNPQGPAKDAKVIVNTNTGEQYISYTNTGVTEVEAPNSKTRYQKCNGGSCRNFYFTLPIPDYGRTTNSQAGSGTINGYAYRTVQYTVNNTPVTIYYASSPPSGWGTGEFILRVKQDGDVDRQIDFTPSTMVRSGTIPSTAKCTPTEGAAVQCSGALDLAMVIDGSGSITDADYKREIDYALKVVDAFKPSTNGIHIGYITFATTSQIVSRLSDNTNNVLVNKIKATPQMQGETNIGDGLNTANEILYSGAGIRGSEYPKIVLLLTDGRANRPNGTNPNAVDFMITAANAVKAKGAKIYAVGVGTQISQDDLDLVASTPTTQYTSLVTNFSELNKTISNIISEVCTGGDVKSTCTTACDPAEVCGCDSCECPLTATSCGARGTFDSNACTCNCLGFWSNAGGTLSDCSKCTLTCGNGGVLNLNTCTCDCTSTNGYTGVDCRTCSAPACNSRQNSVPGTCGGCTCKNYYAGTDCLDCSASRVCNGRGTPNSDCSGCSCDAYYSASSLCKDCGLSCSGRGSANAGCTGCTCTNANGAQWTGYNCQTCGYSCDNAYSTGFNSSCNGCVCRDQWVGADCKTCPVATSTYCNHGHLDGTNCKDCICDTNWKGTRCNQCDFDCNGRGSATTANSCSFCTCNPTNGLWSGTHCETCNPNQCGANGQMNLSTCKCVCATNFTGTYCEKCVTGVCKNGGTPKDQTLCDSCNCKNAWGGAYCETCTLNCVHGKANADCSACVCDDFWTGSTCNVCDNGGAAQDYDSAQCTYHGRLNSDCTACECNYPYNGPNDPKCEKCVYNCNSHGSPNANCNGCNCQTSWNRTSDCLTCDTTSRSYCNNRGTVDNTNGNCDTCLCDTNQWSGKTCTACNIGCQNGGSGTSTDCTSCTCPNYWTAESKCAECGLFCANNGQVTGSCQGCQCVGGYDSTKNCTVCKTDEYRAKCVHAEQNLVDCQCDCTDRWDGQYCDSCPISAANGDCNVNKGQGSVFNGVYNGESECRCKCLNFWVGEDCQNCGLDPQFGSLVCDGIGEPKLDDCTCHCPEYYRDEEGCRVCELTLDQCAHPAPGTTVNTTYGVCSCTCDGNWSARNCSVCAIDCSPKGPGWYLDTDICECVTICGDGIVAGDEQCELDLVDEEIDRVCCDECRLVNVPCDDGVECTFDDLCVNGECYGIGSLDWEIDQDRNPLPTGPFNTNNFNRWGFRFSTSGPINLNVVDSATSSDARYRFPNANAFGGQGSYGKVLAVSQTASSAHTLTMNFSPTLRLKGLILLSVSRQDTSIIFQCSGEASVTKSAYAWGVGSAQAITSPCTNGVNALIFQNIASAAIAELSFCDTPVIASGALGDYVWHDYTRDNIQDSFELGIPRVSAVLKIGSTILATTTTDQNGLYLFDNLFAATYTVTFYGPSGYQFSTPNVVLLNRNILNEGSLVDYPLATGQRRLDVDVGLYLYGSIGDYVFLDDNQNGIQDDALGVEGITLQLYHADDHSTVLATDTTRSTGRYIFNNLPVYKNATTYAQYQVKIVSLPNKAVLTSRFSGSDIRIDSNFGTDLWSDVRQLLPSAPNDFTVDAGIYYCCGSIGDTVFYDNDKDGLQVSNEPGVPNVKTTLYRNDEPIKTTTTDANGKYLFTELPLSGEYQVYWERPSGYLWTTSNVGTNDQIDSDADRDGYSEIVILTRIKPDDLSVDAGVKEGCTVASECSSGTFCQTARCENNVCVYTPSGICNSAPQGCYDQVCDERSSSCKLAPTLESDRPCNDNNVCTTGDVCVPGTGECRGIASSRSCDDGNPCTEGDICNPQGVCAGTPKNCNSGNTNPCVTNTCNATTGACESSPVEALCSDNNRCTINDVCVNGVCVGEPKSCGNSNVCKSSTCNPLTGICTSSNTNGGCDDGNACTINDVCAGGKCAGTPKVCTPPSTCYSSVCSFGNCEDTFLSGKTCDDGNSCTTNDRCDPVSGTCKGTAVVCTPSSSCVSSACVAGTCVETPIVGATCDDGDLCTTSSCENGRCVNTRVVCNDNDPCTDDSCNPLTGECAFVDNTAVCDDGSPCTTLDRCTAGVCQGIPVNCDDGLVCTTDSCVEATGECRHDDNTVRCDDGNACTPTDVCANGECVGYDANTCDGITTEVCKVATCNPVTGVCDITDLDDNSACDDRDKCTQDDACVAGVCQGVPLDCTDGNPCLQSTCVEGACLNTIVDGTCDDGNGCTVDDACVQGQCVGTRRVCDDENPCTDDACVAGECVFTDNSDSCDDGNKCTLNDVCTGGECVGTARVCVSDNVCLDAVCRDGECVSEANSAPCDDGNACTTSVCVDGTCVSSDSVTCPEATACVEYVCNAITGKCDAIPVDGSCEDGNPCTLDDRCVAGICVAGESKVCTSSNPCKAAFCNVASGECSTRSRGNLCDDGNLCTRLDTCIAGECVGTNTVRCSTENPCQTSTCNPSTGTCDVENVDGPCNDRDPCTDNDVCVEGKCVGTIREDCVPDCVTAEDCTEGNACEVARCRSGECVYEDANKCEDDSVCVARECNAETGKCDPVYTDASCDDGSLCTRSDVCREGECVGTLAVTCPEKTCFVGICDPKSGNCNYEPTPDTTCDDGNSCTVNDRCTARGTCEGTPLACASTNPCIASVCENGQCVERPNAKTCDDGNACTKNDRCTDGVCVGTPVRCETSNPCAESVCVAGECTERPVDTNTCDDNNACTVDSCVNGRCVGTRVVCSGNSLRECFEEVCVNGECVERPSNEACDDGNACTENDVCVNGVCEGVPKDCSDFDTACGAGVCEEGTCVTDTSVYEDKACRSEDPCLVDSQCVAGECVGSPKKCDNGNPCSISVCTPGVGCEYTNNPVTCTGRDLCSTYVCIDQRCVVSDTDNCDDNNPCTADACNARTGECNNAYDPTAVCSDNDPCTVDRCTPEGCVSEDLDCDDQNECTNDFCRDGVCVSEPNFNACELDLPCVAQAQCNANGVCSPIANVTCGSTENQCTESVCDPVRGCIEVNVADDTPCEDNDACTASSVCIQGKCTAGPATVCAESPNSCEMSVCDRVTGCGFAPNPQGECEDDDPCTTHSCENGVCVSSAVVCEDSDLCTFNHVCGPNGCVYEEFSCVLNPCVTLDCDGVGKCLTRRQSSNWNPRLYLGLSNEDGTNLVVTANSDNEVITYFAVTDPIRSIAVQPITGEVFAIGGSEGRTLFQIRKFANGTLNSDLVVLGDVGANGLDLSFHPLFRGVELTYNYELMALSRDSSKFITFQDDNFVPTTAAVTPNAPLSALTWDNHGRFLYAAVGKQIYSLRLDSDVQSDVICNGREVIPEGTLIDLQMRVNEKLVGVVQKDGELTVFAVDLTYTTNAGIVCEVEQYTMSAAPFFALPAIVDSDASEFSLVTAAAFDETICLAAVPPPTTGTTGVPPDTPVSPPTNDGTTGTSSGNMPPPPRGGTTGVANNAKPTYPGDDTNYVLTGGMASVSTAVVGSVGAGSVAIFAIFAVVFSLNNTKKDPAVPLSAVLEETEAANLAADNPIFQAQAEGISNVLAA